VAVFSRSHGVKAWRGSMATPLPRTRVLECSNTAWTAYLLLR